MISFSDEKAQKGLECIIKYMFKTNFKFSKPVNKYFENDFIFIKGNFYLKIGFSKDSIFICKKTITEAKMDDMFYYLCKDFNIRL